MKYCISVFVIIIAVLSISCSNFFYTYRRNREIRNISEKSIKRDLLYYYNKNGNVFYVYHTNKGKYFWTYNKYNVYFFFVKKGKIYRKEVYSRPKIDFSNLPNKTTIWYNIIAKCPMSLDGDNSDRFFMMINDKDSIFELGFLSCVECLKNNVYEYEFLNEIIKDIILLSDKL